MLGIQRRDLEKYPSYIIPAKVLLQQLGEETISQILGTIDYLLKEVCTIFGYNDLGFLLSVL